MKFKAVIFDLDGVLVSTDEQHYQGWKALCDRLGIPFDREVNNRFRGVSRMACVDTVSYTQLATDKGSKSRKTGGGCRLFRRRACAEEGAARGADG